MCLFNQVKQQEDHGNEAIALRDTERVKFMLKLNYQIEVESSASAVWEALVQQDKYQRWAKAFSPNSQFKGEWKQGEQVSFFDPELGGTKAIIDRAVHNQLLEYHHFSIFESDMNQAIDSDSARKWIGSRERYHIEEKDKCALLTVTIETHPDFASMFDKGWGNALPLIKQICEQED